MLDLTLVLILKLQVSPHPPLCLHDMFSKAQKDIQLNL